jgi:hypothetical protein
MLACANEYGDDIEVLRHALERCHVCQDTLEAIRCEDAPVCYGDGDKARP